MVLVVLLFLSLLSSQGFCSDQAFNSAVQKVVDCNVLQLKNKTEVRLSGVVCIAEKKTRNTSVQFLKTLVQGKKVRVEIEGERKDDDGRPMASVYLLGVPPKQLREDYLVYEGFLDVDLGLFKGKGKGALVSINSTMIKSGYALPALK